jgi:hypothetical protein
MFPLYDKHVILSAMIGHEVCLGLCEVRFLSAWYPYAIIPKIDARSRADWRAVEIIAMTTNGMTGDNG